jgi:phosphatidylserine decarboxylase
MCRGKNCKCPCFLNLAYLDWFAKVVKADMKRLKELKLDLLKRVNDLAGRKFVTLNRQVKKVT